MSVCVCVFANETPVMTILWSSNPLKRFKGTVMMSRHSPSVILCVYSCNLFQNCLFHPKKEGVRVVEKKKSQTDDLLFSMLFLCVCVCVRMKRFIFGEAFEQFNLVNGNIVLSIFKRSLFCVWKFKQKHSIASLYLCIFASFFSRFFANTYMIDTHWYALACIVMTRKLLIQNYIFNAEIG